MLGNFNKKQKNFAIAIFVLIFASFAFIFSDDSTNEITFEDVEKIIEEDVYEREIAVAPTEVMISPTPTVKVTSIPEQVLGETELEANRYEVIKVVDGDTIDVFIDGEVERLRLIGIDTPETVDPRKPVQCFGIEASNKARELLLGSFVELESDESQSDRDRYGRLLRYVIMENGVNFNEYMISQGYAFEYTYDEAYKYQSEFKTAQDEAKSLQKGLWNRSVCPN